MYNDVTLKGLVRAKYPSIRSLAEHLGWSYSKTYRIVAGLQDASTTEIRDLSIALGLSTPAEVVSVFSLL